jgi:hypothetical protein
MDLRTGPASAALRGTSFMNHDDNSGKPLCHSPLSTPSTHTVLTSLDILDTLLAIGILVVTCIGPNSARSSSGRDNQMWWRSDNLRLAQVQLENEPD